MTDSEGLTRRRLMTMTGQGLAAAGVLSALGPAAAMAQTGGLDGEVRLPPQQAETEGKHGAPPQPFPPDRRIGFAVVGLGGIALEEVIPAFGLAKRARLVALVSGSPDKAATIARQHGIPAQKIYSYERYDELRNDPDVQVVYIALPNSLHAEYSVRASQAGKHVLCEKPMATSPADCQTMIDAAKKADRRLMIAYRMQYEPYNREVIRMARAKELGDLKLFTADNGQNMDNPSQWRLKRSLAGGGALPDVGIYCLNAARYLTGEEPVEVSARSWSTPGDPRFREVEESLAFELRFPSGLLASCTCSYGHHRLQRYALAGSEAWAELSPAFPYRGQRLRVSRAQGPGERTTEIRLDEKNQFALELDHMAQCVAEGRQPHTPGEEGLQDCRIVEQLYASAKSGHAIQMPAVQGLDTTRGPAPDGAS